MDRRRHTVGRRGAGPTTDRADFGPVLTTAEAASYLRVSVRALQDRADIPRVDIAAPGSRKAQWRYRRPDLERFVAERAIECYRPTPARDTSAPMPRV